MTFMCLIRFNEKTNAHTGQRDKLVDVWILATDRPRDTSVLGQDTDDVIGFGAVGSGERIAHGTDHLDVARAQSVHRGRSLGTTLGPRGSACELVAGKVGGKGALRVEVPTDRVANLLVDLDCFSVIATLRERYKNIWIYVKIKLGTWNSIKIQKSSYPSRPRLN